MAMVLEPNAYEAERQTRIQHNQQRLAALGVLQQKTLMDSAFRVVRNPTKRGGPRKGKVRTPPSRVSPRLSGGAAEFAGLSPEEGVEIERRATAAASGKRVAGSSAAKPDTAASPPAAPRPLSVAEAAQRCSSQARGSIYDSVAGICCHFCRQKKLCGETDCPCCANRDSEADCIGKSECGRCGSATGRFCRACLLVRYGQRLDDVRAAGSSWLCPHCYEDEHPDEGWICNSSICLTRRGMRPTGIAIFHAQAQGHASVAHLVAQRLGKPLNPAMCGASKPSADAAAGAGAAPLTAPTSAAADAAAGKQQGRCRCSGASMRAMRRRSMGS